MLRITFKTKSLGEQIYECIFLSDDLKQSAVPTCSTHVDEDHELLLATIDKGEGRTLTLIINAFSDNAYCITKENDVVVDVQDVDALGVSHLSRTINV